jgi:hypothetical protein
MVLLYALGLACDWPTPDRVLASSDLWRAFTLPEYSTRTKREYGRLPSSANAFILDIGRYTAVYQPELLPLRSGDNRQVNLRWPS